MHHTQRCVIIDNCHQNSTLVINFNIRNTVSNVNVITHKHIDCFVIDMPIK